MLVELSFSFLLGLLRVSVGSKESFPFREELFLPGTDLVGMDVELGSHLGDGLGVV